MNAEKVLIRAVSLLLFILLSLSSCESNGDIRTPIEKIDLLSPELSGELIVGVYNNEAPESELKLASTPEPSITYPSYTAIYSSTRQFDPKNVSLKLFYGVHRDFYPENGRTKYDPYTTILGNAEKDKVFEYVNVRIYVEYSGISRVLSVNDNYFDNRNDYLIKTYLLYNCEGKVTSYSDFNHFEEIKIPADVFSDRVGTITVGIDFYGFKNTDDDPAEAKKIDAYFYDDEYVIRRKLGYVNTGEKIILFENPSDALNRYK